jgi:alpha-tubulin suppressor-like RCC1 family protein
VQKLALGGQHTLALLSGGTLAVWGADAFGQLGDGANTARETPAFLPDPTSVVDVSAGRGHSCVIAASKVLCFGDSAFGQLGADAGASSNVPLEIAGFDTPKAIAAGGSHTCVLDQAGTVQCFGWNANGQVGDGSTDVFHGTPGTVQALSLVAEISAGKNHTCARTDAGEIWCWGEGAEGQLGDGLSKRSSNPRHAVLPLAAKSVRAGGDNTCTLLSDGTVSC